MNVRRPFEIIHYGPPGRGHAARPAPSLPGAVGAAPSTRRRPPSVTTAPFGPDNGGTLVVVDDENVRLTAMKDLGGRAPDYEALGDWAKAALGRSHVHVFATRTAGLPADDTDLTIHKKEVPGKNADIEVAIWLTRLLAAGGADARRLVLVSGDVDYLALHALAVAHGLEAGFLVTSRASTSREILALPHGTLGADILRPLRPRTWR